MGQFDELSKLVGAQRSRRGVVKMLGAAALGAVGVASIRGTASARQATPATSASPAAQPAAIVVADGTVVSTRDGRPEETPNQPVQHVSQPGDYDGNTVKLAIAPGVWAFYGHMQPGSITVKAGDLIRAGQVLGRLGNTGNSTALHLHSGLLDVPDPIAGNSLPMIFDRYTLAGKVDGDATMAAFSTTLEPVGTVATPAVATPKLESASTAQTATLSLDLSVVAFS